MNIKTLKVFYGGDFLPYKDKEREVHYPNVGSDFQGAESITNIRFYISEIASNNTTFAVAIELPNGKIGSKVLSPAQYDSELGEYYVTLGIDRFITQKAGNVSISLRGYQGDIQLEYDEVTELYVLVGGTPITAVTGSIKLRVNQEPQALQGDLDEEVTLQEVLALLSTKLNITDGIFVVQDITQANISDLENGQLIYSKNTDSVYKRNTSAQSGYEKLYDIASKSWITANYVPYNGANADVDLGEREIKASRYNIGDIYHTIDLVSNDLVIGTGNGNIWLQPSGVARYIGSASDETATQYEIANIDYVLDNHISVSGDSGFFTQAQINYLIRPNATLVDEDGYVYKREFLENGQTLQFRSSNIYTSISSGKTILHGNKRVKISLEEVVGSGYYYNVYTDTEDFYNKSQADNIFAGNIDYTIDPTTFVATITLKSVSGTTLATKSIDLPLESIVSGATYYDTYTYEGVTYTKVIVLTLSTTSVPTIVPVGDLISGLEKEACVEIPVSPTSGTFTSAQMELLALDNASIKIGGYTYLHKVLSNQFIAKSAFVSADGYKTESEYKVVVQNNGNYTLTSTTINFYDKSQIGTIVQGLQDGIDTNAHDIDTLEGDISDIQGDINALDGRLDNHDTEIAKLKKDVDYAMKYPLLYGTPTTDTEEEMGLTTSQLPATTLPKGLINYVGGMTQKVNQLFAERQTATFNNVTMTNNGDGSYTLNGTATADTYFFIGNLDHLQGHKILFSLAPSQISGVSLMDGNYGNNYATTKEIYNNESRDRMSVSVFVANGTSLDNATVTPMASDLTEIYGSGNEPTTTSDPRIVWLLSYLAKHPEYDGGSIINAPVKNILSLDEKGSDANWFLSNLRKTARVDLGTLNWAWGGNGYWIANASLGQKHFDRNQVSNGVATKYSIGDFDTNIYGHSQDYLFYDDVNIYVSNNDSQTQPSGYLVFELETPLSTPTLTPTEILNSIGAQYTSYPIPAEVQALDGYGLGIDDTLYNYIDFERKKFVKKVGSYTFTGNEQWNWSSQGNGFWYAYVEEFEDVVSGYWLVKSLVSNNINVRLVKEDWSVRVYVDDNSGITDQTDMNALMNNTVRMVYTIETPVETDISEYIDRDFPNENLIDLYQGGEVEFENEDDMGVPYSLTYQYKVE